LRKFLIVLAVIIVLLIAIEAVFYTFVSKYTHPDKKEFTVNPTNLLITTNELTFKSADGVSLSGWLVHGKPDHPVIIIAHDYGSNRSETLGKLEVLITSLNKEGYFILLFDFRGHGKSGSASGLGFKESQDLLAALKSVLKYNQIEKRVGLFGIGMGAIAAINAASSSDEVKFVVLDSVYEDIGQRATKKMMADWPMIKFAEPVLIRGIEQNLKHQLDKETLDLHLARLLPSLYPKGILFIEREPLRPEVKALYDAAREPKEMLLLKDTAVGDLLGKDKDTYLQQVKDKIHKYLPPESEQPTLHLAR